MQFGREKIDALVKRRREGQYSDEFEQGGLLEEYKTRLLEFDSEMLRKEH